MAVKIILIALFFAVMIGIGIYCRRQAADVSGFVLGGRKVGPWLTAFAYGTSYFSAVIFVGYAAVRYRFDLDRTRKRIHRLAFSVGALRPENAHHDTASELGDDAAVLRVAL